MTAINSDNMIDKALKGLNTNALGYNHQDAERQAPAHAILALVAEQRATNWHLNGIAHSLSRIAKALEQRNEQPAPTPEPATKAESKRRLWLPGRRGSGE